MSWLSELFDRAVAVMPERDPTKWDWNIGHERWDYQVGHSPIFSQSILPAAEWAFFSVTNIHTLGGAFGGTGSYLGAMRAQWIDEKLRAWTGSQKSELVDWDPRQSATYTDVVVPTSQGAANIVLGVMTGVWSGGAAAFTVPLVEGGLMYGEQWLDNQLGIPDPTTDYGRRAPLVGAILGTAGGLWASTQVSETPAATTVTPTTTTTPTSTSLLTQILSALTSTGSSTAPRADSPRSPTAVPVTPPATQETAMRLAGFGVLGLGIFAAMQNLQPSHK